MKRCDSAILLFRCIDTFKHNVYKGRHSFFVQVVLNCKKTTYPNISILCKVFASLLDLKRNPFALPLKRKSDEIDIEIAMTIGNDLITMGNGGYIYVPGRNYDIEIARLEKCKFPRLAVI